jgi:CRISPR-associated protein Cmr2
MSQRTDHRFWEHKLAALLHDPPDKSLDIGGHEASADKLKAAAFQGYDEADVKGFTQFVKPADHFASAAERFVFPKIKCATTFDGREGSAFIHPLSSAEYILAAADADFRDVRGSIGGTLQSAVGGIDSDDPRVRFFLYWRRWLENTVTSGKTHARHLAFLPADTRIPDHSVWNHTAVTAALAGCMENGKVAPALLLFQLGPVQDFIAQARSTRDLWSGSYLLSWLMAHAMKAVTDRMGPDAVIFPNLRSNGIFDALHKDDIYCHKFKSGDRPDQTCWERMIEEKNALGEKSELRAARWLLTPTLPNRFLALVPQAQAASLAQAAAAALRDELRTIGRAVWSWIEQTAAEAGCSDVANWKARWDAQIAAFPQTAWAVQPWLEREECLREFARLPVNAERRTDKDPSEPAATPLESLKDMLAFGEQWLPQDHRDPRYYADKQNKTTLNNPGILWSAHYALADAKLAARRNTRDFAAWPEPAPGQDGKGTPKDSLSGQEECIGTDDFWLHLRSRCGAIFKTDSHRYGAMNLVKRLWCRDDCVPYLRDKLALPPADYGKAIRFDSVEDIARGNTHKGPYVAVLAMDGDEMGKWVSGAKAPHFLDQLSARARDYLQPILKDKGKTQLRRLLTPSYHLQFSEALANFATWLAEPVVRAFDGQLIYAGGDDVLAMLPADRAIECARTLRMIFRGQSPENESMLPLAVRTPGFAAVGDSHELVVPGSNADVSVGLAIGHFRAPLQMLVREAQKAEKTAKNRYDRGAVALALYKRSGEIIHWGCKWDSEQGDKGEPRVALALMEKISKWSEDNNPPLSGRFPYALAELLRPYRLQGADESMHAVVLREFEHVLERQGRSLSGPDKQALLKMAEHWLNQTREHLEDFANLFLAETFINRFHGE